MMRSWKAAGCAALAFSGPGPRVRSHRSGLARRRGTAALRRRTEGAGLSPTDSPAGASPLPIQPSRRSPIAAPPVARSDRQRISERPCDTNRRRARWVREVPESRWSTATFLPLAATSSLFRYFVTCFSRLLPRDPAPTGASQPDARCPTSRRCGRDMQRRSRYPPHVDGDFVEAVWSRAPRRTTLPNEGSPYRSRFAISRMFAAPG
jgi:hypothetical protein